MTVSTKALVKTRDPKTRNSSAHTSKTNSSPSINSPVDQIFLLQRTIGNREVERLLKSGMIQAKPTIGQAGARQHTAAPPSAPVIRAKPKVGEPDDNEQEGTRVAELRGSGDGSILSSAVARSYSPRRSLQRLHRNQAVLQARHGSGGQPTRCACGGSAPPGGECSRCRAKRLAASSSLVSDTLRDPGRPLDPATRAGFESSLGHDFGSVRIHADSRAAASAAALDANAYTVGTDVVFGTGRYDPGSAAGRGLIAHELTHVRQQARATPSGPLHVVDDPAAEAEADTSARGATRRMPVAVQRQRRLPERFRPPPQPLLVPPGPIGETYIVPAPPETTLEPSTLTEPVERFPDVLEQRLQGPPSVVLIRVPRCDPDRALTWNDFVTGNPGGGFGAVTKTDIGKETIQGKDRFRASLNGAKSKVRADVRGMEARATNGCQTRVDQCRQVFRGGGFGDFRAVAPVGCDAAVFTRVSATRPGECESDVGTACDKDKRAESARLLRHEQGHFDIPCKLVGRANDALGAGRPFSTVRAWLATNEPQQNSEYENDTANGCDAGQQAAWEARIAANLPAVPDP
jgi:hypothetical protein